MASFQLLGKIVPLTNATCTVFVCMILATAKGAGQVTNARTKAALKDRAARTALSASACRAGTVRSCLVHKVCLYQHLQGAYVISPRRARATGRAQILRTSVHAQTPFVTPEITVSWNVMAGERATKTVRAVPRVPATGAPRVRNARNLIHALATAR